MVVRHAAPGRRREPRQWERRQDLRHSLSSRQELRLPHRALVALGRLRAQGLVRVLVAVALRLVDAAGNSRAPGRTR